MPWSLWSCKSNINIENIKELFHWWIFWQRFEKKTARDINFWQNIHQWVVSPCEEKVHVCSCLHWQSHCSLIRCWPLKTWQDLATSSTHSNYSCVVRTPSLSQASCILHHSSLSLFTLFCHVLSVSACSVQFWINYYWFSESLSLL